MFSNQHLPHTRHKSYWFRYGESQYLRQIQKHKEIKADNQHEIAGVRNLGISSNDYLVWLVHKPAADQVRYVIQPQYIHL